MERSSCGVHHGNNPENTRREGCTEGDSRLAELVPCLPGKNEAYDKVFNWLTGSLHLTLLVFQKEQSAQSLARFTLLHSLDF